MNREIEKKIDNVEVPLAAGQVISVASNVAPEVSAPVSPVSAVGAKSEDRESRSPRGRGRGRRTSEGRASRAKLEFDSVMLTIRRVARVVAGGRRFAFSVAMVAGNRKGQVGVGLGKGADTALAIEKATRHAKKNMIKVNTTKEMSIPHEVSAKYSSASVTIRPVKDRGLVAGSAARTVLELAGLTNVSAKILSPSKNKLNIARATVEALKKINLTKPATPKK